MNTYIVYWSYTHRTDGAETEPLSTYATIQAYSAVEAEQAIIDYYSPTYRLTNVSAVLQNG